MMSLDSPPIFIEKRHPNENFFEMFHLREMIVVEMLAFAIAIKSFGTHFLTL